MNCVLACPLLEIPVIVFETDVDTLSEVARVRNGPEEVGLDQCDVIELRGTGCTSLSTSWVQEHLRKTHTHSQDTEKREKKQRRDLISRRHRVYQLVGCLLWCSQVQQLGRDTGDVNYHNVLCYHFFLSFLVGLVCLGLNINSV